VTPAADQVLGNRYRLTERIAGGGMGEVWRATDEVLGRPVAVKILRREYADDPTFLERFRAEARHAANLSHPGVAAVYDFGEGKGTESGSPFLVMELVPGEPLSALVGRVGALGPERTLDVIGQAALALQAAHDAGVIHRDVKPGNILVTPGDEVKITDFGIARAANSAPLTQTGAIMGTAFYISPEQASGGSVTPASDIYSLGVVAYECLTGRRPFAGDTPVSVALAQVRDEPPALPESVPALVRALVMGMLAKDPADRPSNAGDLGRDALALRPRLADQVAATRALPLAAMAVAGTPVYAGGGTAARTQVVDRPRGAAGADTDPGFRLPTPPRTPTWVPFAVLATCVLLLFLLVRACGGEPDRVSTVGGDGTSDSVTAPATVDVVAADFVGRPVRDVSQELRDLGLRVGVVWSEGDGEVGTVKGVSPTGAVEAGSVVTLDAVDRPSEDEEDDESSGEGDPKGKAEGHDKGEDD
jgi:serine/threonine-protein kinase